MERARLYAFTTATSNWIEEARLRTWIHRGHAFARLRRSFQSSVRARQATMRRGRGGQLCIAIQGGYSTGMSKAFPFIIRFQRAQCTDGGKWVGQWAHSRASNSKRSYQSKAGSAGKAGAMGRFKKEVVKRHSLSYVRSAGGQRPRDPDESSRALVKESVVTGTKC